MMDELELSEAVREAIKTNREDVVNYLRQLELSIPTAIIVKRVRAGDPINLMTAEQLAFAKQLVNITKEELREQRIKWQCILQATF